MYTGLWILFCVTNSKADMWVQMLKGERGVFRSSLLNARSFLVKLETKSSMNGKLREKILEAKKEMRCEIVIQESGKVPGLLKCGITERQY